jgi:uncharacterized protein (TIGR03435 family)
LTTTDPPSTPPGVIYVGQLESPDSAVDAEPTGTIRERSVILPGPEKPVLTDRYRFDLRRPARRGGGLWLLAIVVGVHAVGAQSSTLRFDVVSVKENTGSDRSIRFDPDPPDGFRRINLPLASLVPYAFNVPQPSRIIGLPEWTRNVRYDISGKAARAISDDERRLMVRNVLEDDFGVVSHVESREQTIYVLSAARPDKRLGPGLKPRPDCDVEKCSSGGTGRPDGLEIRAITLTQLADGMLSSLRREIVRDETGIPGTFDVTMSWRPDTAANDGNDSRPSFVTAIQEQLGLKLEVQRRPVDVLVIDRIERAKPD